MPPTATPTAPASAHDQYIVLWRTTGRGLRALFTTSDPTPLTASRDALASYSTTPLTDPDALQLDTRYLVRTQDARAWFGLDV